MADRCLVVVGHGSRLGAANEPFEAFVAALAGSGLAEAVRPAYVELARPSLPDVLDAVAREHSEVLVLPLFLFAAGHVKSEIPLAIERARQAYPHVRFVAARPLGVHPEMASLALARLREHAPAAEDAGAVLLVGRGASDPDANGDFCKLTRLVAEGWRGDWVLPCFIGISSPLLPDMLELVARMRPARLAVMPYMLFPGRLVERLEEMVAAFAVRYPWIAARAAPSLGLDPRLTEVFRTRLDEAVAGTGELPCVTCQFRTAMPGVASQVGGLEALLWSVRHSFTHQQAASHVHAHAALEKHVLVCVNTDCASRGSLRVADALRQRIRDHDKVREWRVTRTMCMGRCGEGPAVAVYPDGVWYREFQVEDVPDLVDGHLAHDQIVARRVDGIMG